MFAEKNRGVIRSLSTALVIQAYYDSFICLNHHLNVLIKYFVYITTTFLSYPLSLLVRETNLKFKMGLRVTDERLQEERQLAAFDGELHCFFGLFLSTLDIVWIIIHF